MRAGHFQDAAAHLRDGLQIAVRAGDLWNVAANGLFFCALLCTATGLYAEAATVWAAQDVHARQQGLVATSPGARMREEALRTIRQVLGPARVRAALSGKSPAVRCAAISRPAAWTRAIAEATASRASCTR